MRVTRRDIAISIHKFCVHIFFFHDDLTINEPEIMKVGKSNIFNLEIFKILENKQESN